MCHSRTLSLSLSVCLHSATTRQYTLLTNVQKYINIGLVDRVCLCVVYWAIQMKIEPIKLSRVRKKTRTNETMKNGPTKNEAKRKLSYTPPIKWNETNARESSSCCNMFGIVSRDNVLPFSILAFGSALGAVCRSCTHFVLESGCVFSVFIIPTDWLSQLFHYSIHSFGCRLDIFSSFWPVSSTVRNVSYVSFFMFVGIVRNIEARMTTNMFVEICLCTRIWAHTFVCALYSTSDCDAAAHIKSFFGYIDNDDTGEVTKTISHTQKRSGKKIGKNTGQWGNGIDILLPQCRETQQE